MNKIWLIALLTLVLVGSVSLMAQNSKRTSTDPASWGCRFIDEDGDGLNDNFRDHDGDGIPNRLDSDWTRPQDGTGYKDRNQRGNSLRAQRQRGGMGAFREARGLGNGLRNGTGICNGTAQGPGGGRRGNRR